jgi:peptidylprolyl isomerase
LTIALCVGSSLTLSSAGLLPAGNAITDGKAILRYALPIDNQPVRKIQADIEGVSDLLRGKRWQQIANNAKRAVDTAEKQQDQLLASVDAASQAKATELIAQIVGEGKELVAAAEAKNRPEIQKYRTNLLNYIGELEEKMVAGFPYTVPAEYNNLPQLKGRATIAMKTTKGDIEIIVDGYSAPVTAGNFVDLVRRKFYDKMPFTRAEDSYVVQAGDPPGNEVGFIDPQTKKYRAVPLEILVQGDPEPTYGITLEDAGRYNEAPVLPFSAFGAVAMARPEPEPDGGSSQFFFFLFEPELTPAGRNLLDGRYAVFGYVTEGKEVLDNIRPSDTIVSARIVAGEENLIAPTK